MKRNILMLSLSMLFAFGLNAQISVDPEVVEANYPSADLTDNWLDLYDYVAVTNTSSETVELKWVREIPADCPGEWQSQICDNNLCYGFDTSTNYVEGGSPSAPFVLEPNETFSEFAFHFLPRMTAGCCTPKIHFSLVDSPDDIIATVTYNLSVNDNSCFSSSTEETSLLNLIKLYPNPSYGMFTLTENNVVERLSIFNVLGKQMKQLNYFPGDNVDVSDLPDGMYLVAMQDGTGQVLKTLRLSKRSLQP